MFLPQLNPKLLHQAIIFGCEALVREKDQLNAINIFPIADNDTGDNLASTAIAIINDDGRKSTFKELFQTLANASLFGARGNSGVIFSQFFNALAMTSFDKKQMNPVDLSVVLANAALLVRKSIACPVEGTILTMMESFAEASCTLSKKIACFNQLMEQSLSILKDRLNKTTDSLPVLKQANIVDAGALGFYIFVEGFAAFLSGTHITKPNKEKSFLYKSAHPIIIQDSPPLHRYCTEALISAESIDLSLLTKIFEEKGDSLAFSGNQHMQRLHIHTNTPRDVFSTLMSHGTITAPKVDDMLRQYQLSHDKKHNIALVTDSSADIPQALIDEYQIHLIPLNIHLDQHTLLDRYCLDPLAFYQNLNTQKNHPKTSLPSMPVIEEKLRRLSQHYEQVIFISIAKAMSGTFDVVTQVAKKYPNVAVIDSRTNSGAQGLLVQYAGELIKAQHSFQSIMTAIEKAISETSIFVIVNEFESMVRSGRINTIAGQMARLSGIKPIISIDKTGKGSLYSSAFSTRSALSKLIKIIEQVRRRPGKELAEYCIVHAGVEEKANDFAKLTTKALQKPPAYIEDVSAVIGLHAGQGCIALAARMRSTKDAS